jgi:hypothetical protein
MNDGMELEIVTLPAKLSVCLVMRIDFDRIDVKFILVKIDFFFFLEKVKIDFKLFWFMFGIYLCKSELNKNF